MALRNIVKEGDEVLRKHCRPVTEVTDRIRQLIDDLTETMRDAEGVGLAAPQVGVLRRVCVVEVEDQLYELVNPEIVAAEGEQFDQEACLSVPECQGWVRRPFKVTVRAQDRNGETVEYTGEGLLARAFCHEIDHLDGILYIDKVEDGPDGEQEEE